MLNRPVPAMLLVLLVTVALAVPAAFATSVERMTLGDLVSRSPAIVYGSVVASQSRWNGDRTLIVTEVRIRVLEAIKGAVAGEIVVTQPGGQIGKLLVEVPGAAAFRPGEEAVLFLAPAADGALHVNGLSQGRFDVVEDRATGARIVRGLGMMTGREPGLAPAAGAGGGAGGEPLPLDRFLDGLRDMVDGSGTKGGK